MDSTSIKLLPIVLMICLSASKTATAEILGPKSSLSARMKLQEQDEEGSSTNCWESLFELQSCTTEVMFFLNGETYLGQGCCGAIRIIQHDCWPAMLGSLGYTDEEGDVLRVYCDAKANAPLPPSLAVDADVS